MWKIMYTKYLTQSWRSAVIKGAYAMLANQNYIIFETYSQLLRDGYMMSIVPPREIMHPLPSGKIYKKYIPTKVIITSRDGRALTCAPQINAMNQIMPPIEVPPEIYADLRAEFPA